MKDKQKYTFSRKVSILEQNKDEVISMRENGDSMNTIAEKFEVSHTLVQRKLFEWDVEDTFNLDDKKEEILSLKFDDAKTNKEIAEEIGLNYDPNIITLAFSRWNIDRSTDSQVIRKDQQKEEIEEIKQSVIDWYYKTGSSEKVANVFHYPQTVIREKLGDWDVLEQGSGPGNSYWQERFYTLPPNKRKEILGTYYDRFLRAVIIDDDYEDIAEDLDMSIGGVKSGIHRAKNKIEEYLDGSR